MKTKNGVGAYVNTGYWSQRAQTEASKFIETVQIANAGELSQYQSIPSVDEWKIPNNKKIDYIHICGNETIHGLEYLSDPQLDDNSPPIIADFTSTLFSRPINFKSYGAIYASAGKNFGPAGVTIVIAREDLVSPHLGDKKQTRNFKLE